MVAQVWVLLTSSAHEGLASTEKEDAHAHVIELLHLTFDLFIRVDDRGDVIDGTVFAVEVALIGDDDCS